MKTLMTASEVADILGYSRQAIYNMVKRGALKPVKGIGRIRFDPVYIDNLLGIRKQEKPVQTVPLEQYNALKTERDELFEKLARIGEVMRS